ncbi:MAG: hypothetical protein MUE40_06435 [Anaerolineae bacterium]|jgi:hypothetical protein|nr:hypothetical protein [Anaerolineae bacterium]
MIYQVMTGMRFMLLWLAGSLITIGVAILTAGLMLALVSIVVSISLLTGGTGTAPLVQASVLLAFAVTGAVIGLSDGSLQQAVLRQKYQAQFRGWRWLSVIGGSAGMLLAALALNLPLTRMLVTLRLPAAPELLFYGIMPVLLPMVGMSIARWFVLRRYVVGAWTWVLANIVAGLVLYSLIISFATGGLLLTLLPGLFVLVSPAIVTGFALLWLFQFNARSTFPDAFY